MQCKYCFLELNEDNCYQSDWKRGGYICKTCRKTSYRKNITPAKSREYGRSKILVYKKEVLQEYGAQCYCCGQKIWQFLTIDHIDNSGSKHRKEIGHRGGTAIYQWLKRHSYPKDNFRLLCMNCNASIGFHGFCSHEFCIESSTCLNCNINLDEKSQYSFYAKNGISLCKSCVLIKSRTYSTAKDVTKNYRSLFQRRKEGKAKTLKIRQNLIENYGEICECCGENDYMFLTIDHIKNDGVNERKQFKNDMGKFYRTLIKSGYPKDNYRLLCYNCNCCRGSYGECYHELLKNLNVSEVTIDDFKLIIKNRYVC